MGQSEVDSNSVIVWVRLTQSPEAVFERLPIFTQRLQDGDPDIGSMSSDVVPSVEGETRVLFWPNSKDEKSKKSTDWERVIEENGFIYQFKIAGLRAGTNYSYELESRESNKKYTEY